MPSPSHSRSVSTITTAAPDPEGGTPPVKDNSVSTNDAGDDDDSAGLLPIVIGLTCALLAGCVFAGVVWMVKDRKGGDAHLTQAAATTINAAYTVADTLPRARSSTTGLMDDEAGYLVPSPLRSSGGSVRTASAEGYQIPALVPAASGYVLPLEEPFGLKPQLIRVDKNKQLGKGHYGEVFRGTLVTEDGTTRTIDVAIKMLPQDRDVDDRERQDFWEEIKFLRHL